jgi:hypothetical protein
LVSEFDLRTSKLVDDETEREYVHAPGYQIQRNLQLQVGTTKARETKLQGKQKGAAYSSKREQDNSACKNIRGRRNEADVGK